jgi:hypothetical protein
MGRRQRGDFNKTTTTKQKASNTMNRQQYIAEFILVALMNHARDPVHNDHDLRYACKSKIGRVILTALEKAEVCWPAYEEWQNDRKSGEVES